MKDIIELKLKFKKEGFSLFQETISDLSNISDVVKIVFNTSTIFFFAVKNEDKIFTAMKYQIVDTDEIFENYNSTNISEVNESNLEFILKDSGKYHKSLSFFDDNSKVTFILNAKSTNDKSKPTYHVRASKIESGKFKISKIGEEISSMPPITIDMVENMVDPINVEWKIDMSVNDLEDIKKLCRLHNSELTTTVEVDSIDGQVTFSELGSWEMNVGEIEEKSRLRRVFVKKYLYNVKCMKGDTHVTFNMYPNFIGIRDKKSVLIITYESNYD